MKKYPIGFCAGDFKEKENVIEKTDVVRGEPKKSVVQVYFDSIHRSYAYYNDSFDLKVGDAVYVEGKLEGVKGVVMEVNYSFKIKLSDYKKVIHLIDTRVEGEFSFGESTVMSFDKNAIPFKKIRDWYIVPQSEEEFVSGKSEKSFPVNDLSKMGVSFDTGQKGHEIYMESDVPYVELDKEKGRAIVKGSKHYEVEFDLCDNMVSNLTCSCFASGFCKHTVAAMYQLRECLDTIKEENDEMVPDYFAAMGKSEFLVNTVMKKNKGKIKVEV